MNDYNESIEAYFKGELNDDEKKRFEERCLQDEVFAREVAIYITSREAARQLLLEQKNQQWAEEEPDKAGGKTAPVKKMTAPKWLLYAAAAFFVLAVGAYFFYRSPTPRQLAKQYVGKHLTQISQTMSASGDSLQQGIAAYNNKDYAAALRWFEQISPAHPQYYTARKYSGIVYLVTRDYDKAIKRFDELVNHPDLNKNPGLFLKAVALLERNKQGDKEQAKQLLDQAVKEKAEGSREAQKWLEEW